MAPTPVNIHGRKGTRGLRPWLLIPKVVAVAVYLGGLAALLAVVWHLELQFGRPDKVLTEGDLALVRFLLQTVIDPAAIAATGLGLLLFACHFRQFARQRWWQVKMACLLLGVPACKLLLDGRLAAVQGAIGLRDPGPLADLRWVLAGAIAWVLALVVLGRLKPRLGQNWARAYVATAKTARNSGAAESARTAPLDAAADRDAMPKRQA